MDISELDSPIKHYILGNMTPSNMPHNIPPYEQLPSYSSAKEMHHELSTSQIDCLKADIPAAQILEPETFDHLPDLSCTPDRSVVNQTITNTCNPTYHGHAPVDKATICVGLNMNKSSSNKNLDSVIETLNSQLDVVSTEIRDKINELSTITPEVTGASNDSEPEIPKEDEVTSVVSDLEKLSTSHMMDELYPENTNSPYLEAPESKPTSPQGLTIEELEPISAPKPKRKQKRNNSQKEEIKRRKKSDSVSVTAAVSSEKPGCSNADPNQPGETEYLSNIQRVLTSNMMPTSTQPKKARAPKQTRKKSVPMISLDEQTLMAKMAEDTSQHSVQEDPTLNSKLLTELQRLLTQNNIRTALQGEQKKRKCNRPSLDSPPYIRPPQLHDSTSMDGSRFTLVLDKPRMFPCLQCNKEFKTKQCLKRHISRHLGVKLHICSYCNKRFNDKSNMKRHAVTHINVRKFTCDVCDQTFYRKEVMELHKRRIHTIPNDILNCRFKKCGFTCKIPYKLVEHIQTVHFHNYRYNCEKCNYKTQHNVNYLKHLRVHSGDRPFKCQKCGKGFKQRNARKKHSYVHLDRPHKCEICLKTFCLELALRIHYENNHGPRAAQKKLHEKRKREILRKYRQQRSVHSKKISFVNLMPTKL